MTAWDRRWGESVFVCEAEDVAATGPFRLPSPREKPCDRRQSRGNNLPIALDGKHGSARANGYYFGSYSCTPCHHRDINGPCMGLDCTNKMLEIKPRHADGPMRLRRAYSGYSCFDVGCWLFSRYLPFGRRSDKCGGHAFKRLAFSAPPIDAGLVNKATQWPTEMEVRVDGRRSSQPPVRRDGQ